MTRLIYDSPVEYNDKLMVSTEILTHYRCPACDVFSSASDLLPDELVVYCHSCGGRIELPPMGINLVGNRKPTQAEIDYGKELKESEEYKKFFTERFSFTKTNAISPDAGMPK